MSGNNRETTPYRNLSREPFDDAVFGLCLSRAVFERDADQAFLLLTDWLQACNLTLGEPARRALLSALRPGNAPDKDG